jgi:phosphatidyl-myo-inositol alpha-mannosyltransferase
VRVALVTEFAYPVLGGVSEHVHFLSRELVRLGHEATVVTAHLGRRFPGAREVDREAERLHGYRTVRAGLSVPVRSNGSIARGAFAPGLKPALLEALRDMDVVHVQGLAAPTLPLFGLRASRAPVTAGTFHTYVEGEYLRLYRFWGPYTRNSLARADRHIAVSQPVVDAFAPLFPGEWRIIPNGVDTELFRPLEPGERRPPGPPRVLFVGRLEPRNALDVLLGAAAILRREGREIVVQVVGDGPARARHEREARELGVADRVEWLGAQLEERPRLYREATIFAAPCVLASFGVILLEALASGTPVVGADNVGFRRVIGDGVPGRLVAPHDAPALAAALTALLDDAEARADWAARGRRAAEQLYGWPGVARRVVALYEEVLEENGPGRRPLVRPMVGHVPEAVTGALVPRARRAAAALAARSRRLG